MIRTYDDPLSVLDLGVEVNPDNLMGLDELEYEPGLIPDSISAYEVLEDIMMRIAKLKPS